jgi:hypothetical protein
MLKTLEGKPDKYSLRNTEYWCSLIGLIIAPYNVFRIHQPERVFRLVNFL